MDRERRTRSAAAPTRRGPLTPDADTRRAFVAFEIPAEIRRALAADRRDLEVRLPRARWVRADNMHLTLRFLGDVATEDIDRLGEALRSRCAKLGEVGIRLGGAGFFPRQDRPRVAWIGGVIDGIEAVIEALDEAVAEVGFPPRDRPWALHLTQARLNSPWRRQAVKTFLDWGDGLDLTPFTVRELVIFVSDLRPGGAVYTAVERVPLCDR